MPERLRDLIGLSAAMLLGVAVFFVFCGWWVLIPDNIAWLDVGDRPMHQLGWMFYRAAPWGLPPGSSPLLGLELGHSIALADGLPLFAIPFKLVAAWLPQPFQYWGYWLLLSFVLQAAFGWRIARELGAGRAMALVAAGFVLITPAFLFRVPMHMALAGHWTILAALLLHVRRAPPTPWMWPLLGAVTAAIHATLLAMVLALWVAALAERAWTRRAGLGALGLEALATGLGVFAVLWAVGFFGTTDYGTYGYGWYRLNLLWPVIAHGWSMLMPDLAHTRYDYEGLGFAGIGVLALAGLAVLSGAVRPLWRLALPRWLPLAAMAVALMGFAFSHRLVLGETELAELAMPGIVMELGAAFRSTGRFVWPLLYLLTIGTVVLVARRLRPALALPLALLAFGVQAVDSSGEWTRFRRHMPPPAPVWQTPLASPFWARAAAAGHDRVRAIPIRMVGRDWRWLGYYAVTHGMGTDSVYLARIDAEARAGLEAKARALLETGAAEPGTLYVLDVPAALATMAHLAPDDLMAIVDGRIVFARGGAGLIEGLGIDNLSRSGGSWLAAVAQGGSVSD